MTDPEFRNAFYSHKDVLYRFVCRMTGSADGAEDIVQECFLALWRKPDAYDPNRGALRAFLLGIARNLVLKRWRDEHPHESLEDDSFLCEPADLLGQERAEMVARAVQMGSQALQVRIEPFTLSATQLEESQMVDPSWTPIPLLKYPLVPDVRAGDTVAIDLLENPSTGQKVVDYLAFKRSNPAVVAEPGPLGDLSLAEVEIQLKDFRISVNGTMLDASTRLGGSISGAALWFYLPERGRFILSLVSNPKLGFHRAGEVSNRSLTFTEGPERYDIESTSRIVPAWGRFNLYVLHDSNWRPTRGESNWPIIVGAADRAEWLAAK